MYVWVDGGNRTIAYINYILYFYMFSGSKIKWTCSTLILEESTVIFRDVMLKMLSWGYDESGQTAKIYHLTIQ